MKYDRIIWDFNGTILDDLQVGISSADELLTRHGLPKIKTVERYYGVFGFPIIDYYKRIGFDFNKIPYPVLAHEWVDIYLHLVDDAPLRNGVKEAITHISELGLPQTVLSMTKQDMLEKQLESLGLINAFDEICGLNDIYAESKLTLASKWHNNHRNERALFIGDTTHDAESADVIGCDCLLISGGHQSRNSLLQSNVKVIDSPSEIIDMINQSI